jgi:hypothetical protein
MNIERLKQRLNGLSSKNSVNTDTFLNVNLVNNERLLPYGDINKIINSGERFTTERNKCSFYRILGSINLTATNALFNINDSSKNNAFTWSTFNDISFLDTSYPDDFNVEDKEDYTYSLSIQNYLKEKDGWFGHYEPDLTKTKLCEFFDMEPKRERFSFLPDFSPFHPTQTQLYNQNTSVKNWEMTITYPAAADKTHNMINNGLLIIESISTTLATRTMVAFGVACKHNLKIGDFVRISGTNGYDGDHIVVRTGLENGDLKDYYFVLDLPPTGIISVDSRMKKLYNGFESEYYFRKFKKIKTKTTSVIETDDYETYELGFSETIFSDDIVQFVFNEDIDVDGLIDNLGRPLSELYLTLIKTDSNNLFTRVSSGIETPLIEKLNTSDVNLYLKKIPAINKIHNGGDLPFISHNPFDTNVRISDEFYYGDLVEYNVNTLKEVVLAEVQHRFNTLNRETNFTLSATSSLGINPVINVFSLGPRHEGYYYKAHHNIKIREFSSYIEVGDENTYDLPTYATDMGDGRFVWRDLLDIGFNETDTKGLDYPFVNGSHYMYNNYSFFIKRQDPFNEWDLFYTNYPSDPIGGVITDKFTVNSSDDVC